MNKFGICGFSGRMGQTIFSIIQERQHSLSSAFDAPSSPLFGQSVLDDVKVKAVSSADLQNTDVVIDFSSPAATMQLLDAARKSSTGVVIGTTGLDENQERKIKEASKFIPIMWAPNMSVGVNLLFKLAEMASKSIPAGYDAEIFEAHHKFKKDAPSGTANKLYSIVKENCPRLQDADKNCTREGIIGERPENEIGMQVMRGGDIVGEHTLFFAGMGERIEITHRATNRRTFAEGAVTAAEFISGKQPGLYNMYDVLGF